jgi:ABC-2 type transport system permease protein
MRILDLMLKDLRQILRDRSTLIFLLVMPIAFTAFMGAVLRPAEPGDPRLPVGLVIEDDGVLGQNIETLMAASTAIRPVRIESASDAESMTSKGEVMAALILRGDFSAQMMDGEQPNLTLIADTLTPEGHSARQAVQGVVMRLLSAAEAATLSVQAVQPAESNRAALWNASVEHAVSQWLQSTLTIQVEQATAQDEAAQVPSAFAQSSPGMLVMFAIFGLINSAMVLVLERKTRTLQRLLTTSMHRAEIIAGHLLAMFTLVFVQGVILIGVGQFAFGVDYLRQWPAVMAVLIAMALWVASMGLFISALAKGEEQVVLFSLIAMFLLSALGGAWFPLEGTGGAFAAIGKLTPTAWAMTGFQNLIVRGLEFTAVLLPVGLLLAYAAAFFGLAVWRFKFE